MQTRLVDILSADPAFDKSRLHYMGRNEKFAFAMVKDKRLAQLAEQYNWSKEEAVFAEALCDLPGPFGLHKR